MGDDGVDHLRHGLAERLVRSPSRERRRGAVHELHASLCVGDEHGVTQLIQRGPELIQHFVDTQPRALLVLHAHERHDQHRHAEESAEGLQGDRATDALVAFRWRRRDAPIEAADVDVRKQGIEDDGAQRQREEPLDTGRQHDGRRERRLPRARQLHATTLRG